MDTLKLTTADFENGRYKAEKLEYDGHVEIAENLDTVWFASINVTGRLIARAGSGIEAGEGIKAGWGIKAGSGIKAGWGIEAGWGIKAGSGIKAGEGIKAGWGIKAGEGIEAGWGIEAGLSIQCIFISAKFRIFAGLISWRLPTPDEQKIICAEVRHGTVAYGTLEILELVKA